MRGWEKEDVRGGKDVEWLTGAQEGNLEGHSVGSRWCWAADGGGLG